MSNESVGCAACGNEEPAGSRFCGNCGAPLPAGHPHSTAEPGLPPEPARGRRLGRVAVIGAVLLLLAAAAIVAAVVLTGGNDSPVASATTNGQIVSLQEDCGALTPVVTHLGLAADPSSADGWVVYPYAADGDVLDSYAVRAAAEIRPDVIRLRDFLTRYAAAAQAAGAESRQIPDRGQLDQIKAQLNLSSAEEADLRTSVQLLVAWTANRCGGGSTAPVATTTSGQSVPAGDCTALGTAVADMSVGAHADDLVPTALDISASDYIVDRDFLAGFGGGAPAEIRADVVRLGTFLERYASAAQAAGLEPGAVSTPDQASEIRAAAQMGSVEQDQLPESIRILGIWAANGCTGGKPPSETTPAVTTPAVTSPAVTIETVPIGAVDQKVTAAVNEIMAERSERELGSPPVGAEVRNCRKERDFSAESLLAPGGAAYFCEVWFEGERLSDGPAVIDVDGNVVLSP